MNVLAWVLLLAGWLLAQERGPGRVAGGGGHAGTTHLLSSIELISSCVRCGVLLGVRRESSIRLLLEGSRIGDGLSTSSGSVSVTQICIAVLMRRNE